MGSLFGMSGVRNKIASFEAHNKQVQASSSPARIRMENTEMSPARSTSTALAAQNRVSRIKQEQQMNKDGKTLVDKRKLLKERRILQQKRTPASEEHISLPMDQRLNLPRRTEYTPVDNDHSKPPEEQEPIKKKEPSVQAMSPGRNTRLSKVQQRMQKMKGFDQSKKVAPSRPSNAASTTESTATTTVAQNSSNKPLQRRHRQASTLMQTRAKRVSDIKQSRNALRTPDAAANAEKASTCSTSPPTRSRHQRPSATSPTSDVDVFSDNNYAYGPTDQSIEATDDEATLTSVRRIMAGENNGLSPRDKSIHYQHLQTFEESHRSGRTMPQSTHARSTHSKSSRVHNSSRLDNWPQEEKSDKAAAIPRVFQTESSSDYDTDGDMSKNSRQSQILDGPSHSQVTDVNDFFTQSKYPPTNRRMDDDERTFDYGDRDDASNASGSFAVRQRRVLDPPPEPSSSKEWKEATDAEPSSLLNKDDVEHYTKSFGSPAMKVGVGVIGAFTVGCIVLGPAGLLAGAAIVGLGVGAMQIPDKERQKIQAKVQKTVRKVHAKALDATESLSNSCVTTYEESGVAEHLPPCLSLATDTGAKDNESTRSDKRIPGAVPDESKIQSNNNAKASGASPTAQDPNHARSEPISGFDRPRNKKVACLRNGKYAIGGTNTDL